LLLEGLPLTFLFGDVAAIDKVRSDPGFSRRSFITPIQDFLDVAQRIARVASAERYTVQRCSGFGLRFLHLDAADLALEPLHFPVEVLARQLGIRDVVFVSGFGFF